jgi:hypothetical protein
MKQALIATRWTGQLQCITHLQRFKRPKVSGERIWNNSEQKYLPQEQLHDLQVTVPGCLMQGSGAPAVSDGVE